MPLSRNYITVFWVIALLQLAGCGHAPVAGTPPATTARAPQAKQADQSRRTVTSIAQRMLGTPYRYGGASPRGFDCSGLVWYSHQRAGIRVPRTASAQQRSAKQQVAVRDLQIGDLLFFRIAARRTDHVGIYIGSGQFIHAPSRGGTVARASLSDAYWKKRLVGAGNYY